MKITYRKIIASTDYQDDPLSKKIQEGLEWNIDGHTFRVLEVRKDECQIGEGWIAEDTGRPHRNVEWYLISTDEDGSEYAWRPEDEKYAKGPNYSWWARKYASGADNIDEIVRQARKKAEVQEDDYDEDYEYEEYTPSATRGDYSPSSPWNAPGMSMSDFI